MSRKIPLTQGMFAIVDDEDFELLNNWKWYARKCKNRWYATRPIRENGKNSSIQMHRTILGLKKGDKIDVDHINHNGLDNRKINIRSCTRSQNSQNARKQRGCTSQYKGVSWEKSAAKWHAQIMLNGINYFLGYYQTENEAAIAYNDKAKELFGDFACLNDLGVIRG